MTDPEAHEHTHEDAWRAILTGKARGLQLTRKLVGWIPAGPRCKLCLAPLKPPGSVLLKIVGFGPSRLNRRLCRACFRAVEKNPGGAEIELSFLFADIRGSTSLAEHIPAQEYSKLISRFYGKAAEVVDKQDGLVDKFVGDEVVALFVPGFVDGNPAEKAIEAARGLLRETGNDGGDPWIPVGAGVHTGIAYVGRVGEGDACDFTAVGDAANLTARLASSAAAGEILVSSSAAHAAELDTDGLESRTLELRGREGAVDAWVATAETLAVSPAEE
ncbi:MAG: adenylate/guanylate cyclase domain-containing protein [Actinobacteria bacterium]|nr:adenylate/guanylate cyclase domain-containing protein [Actinomycetota bacterium]